MTVLLSFEEKTDDACACAQSGHCPFKAKCQFTSCEKLGAHGSLLLLLFLTSFI